MMTGLSKNLKISLYFLILSAAHDCSLHAEERSFSFLNTNVERMSSYNNVRYKTFGFMLDEAHPCHSFTSYIVSKVNRFSVTTPLYQSILYASRSKSDGSTYIYSEAPTCKYKLTINKFVMRQGKEYNLGHTSQAKLDAIIARLNIDLAPKNKMTDPEMAKSDVPIDNSFSAPLPQQNGTKKEANAVISVKKSDPFRDGISQTGASFESDDDHPEYTGMFYCAPASCSLFLANAGSFYIKDASDQIGDRHEIDVMGPDTRLHITLERIIDVGLTKEK